MIKKKLSFEAQLTCLSLITSVPLLLLLLWVMIYAKISVWLILLSSLIATIVVVYTSHRIYHKLAFQFLSLANLLDSMIRGDYSMRARPHDIGALGDLVVSINGLAQRLSQQRSESVESQLLLQTVIEHIDVAIIALTRENQISFYNPAAKKLLLLDRGESSSKLLRQLAFVKSFSSGHNQVVELSLGLQQGRFNVHVEEFRESGAQHKLLFITDVRTLLRSEERKTWQSLVRVISHEINNSLSPIASISQTLSRMITRQGIDTEVGNDLIEGLTIISERADGLRRFVDSYKQLAKLPEPQKKTVSITKLMEKVRVLFKNQKIDIDSVNDVELLIDPLQFEQALINLVKNAVESMAHAKSNGAINIKWQETELFFRLTICDQGGGIGNPDNLFVPFYSTKKHGSGIGLILCRQIIEAYNGRLSVANRTDAPGCCATIEIPSNQTGHDCRPADAKED